MKILWQCARGFLGRNAHVTGTNWKKLQKAPTFLTYLKTTLPVVIVLAKNGNIWMSIRHNTDHMGFEMVGFGSFATVMKQ